MAGKVGQKSKTELVAVETEVETPVTSAIELITNESREDRQAKRLEILAKTQAHIAANIHDAVLSATGVDAEIKVGADRFTLEDSESYEAECVAALFGFLRSVDVTDTIARDKSIPAFTNDALSLSLSWYDLVSEYRGAEGLHAIINEWKRNNPLPISDIIVEEIAGQLDLSVRVLSLRENEVPVGDADAVLQAVYNRIARCIDEQGEEITPVVGKAIPLTSSDEGSSNYAVDLLRSHKRYTSNEAFAAAMLRAKSIAKTILANRYGVQVGSSLLISDESISDDVA